MTRNLMTLIAIVSFLFASACAPVAVRPTGQMDHTIGSNGFRHVTPETKGQCRPADTKCQEYLAKCRVDQKLTNKQFFNFQCVVMPDGTVHRSGAGYNAPKTGLSNGAKWGIGVGTVVGAALLGGIIYAIAAPRHTVGRIRH